MMKVVILHNDLRVYWKGRIKYLCQFLAEHNISVHAIELFGKGSPYYFDPVDIDNCLFPDNSHDELTKSEIKSKLFAKLDEINPDVIIAGSIVFFSGALGLNWARKHNKHFIMFDDGKPSVIKRNALVQYIKNTITSQADALWLPSKDYDAEYNCMPDKPWLFHGYNTIDNNLFKIANEKQLNHNVIICVARLVDIKNIDNLLNAWKLVEEQDDTYKLQIIGSGPAQEKLENLSLTLGLKRVEFAGLIANKDLPTYLFNADAFILASFAESWGLVVNEALAASLPVLLSKKVNAGAVLLEQGGNGYVFDAHDANEIADKILTFINQSQPVKKQMSDRSLQIINTMDYENMGNELLSVLNKMTNQPSKKVTLMGKILLCLWRGGYNTSGWNK
jgi:glycosyltransferase involved in cell wall biosynthesis